jgi:hypothetical protein
MPICADSFKPNVLSLTKPLFDYITPYCSLAADKRGARSQSCEGFVILIYGPRDLNSAVFSGYQDGGRLVHHVTMTALESTRGILSDMIF